MSSLIETLNLWGAHIPHFAWPMLWQSSLLIAVLFAFDFAVRRKVRAAVRYALWLVVLVKLLLPPTLALPTSLAWWVRPAAASPKPQTPATAFVVTYGDFVPANFPMPAPPVLVPAPRPSLSGAGRTAVTWAVVGVGLLSWLVARWRRVRADVRQAVAAPESLNQVLDQSPLCIKLPRGVRLLVTKRAMSPAVCGLFRPVILLPQSLVERLTPSQLRAVLLHELVHLRRGDVWVNCLQALLQIFYWWHPLLWLANARIRRVREEAVDDAVMLALRDDAESYAPTLLEVAKLAFNRPLASLGLVGIMESRSALRQRIERLMDFRPPRRAGLTTASALCVLAFAVFAVPMEQAPATSATPVSAQKQTESTNPPPVELSNDNEEVKLRMIILNKPVGGDATQIRKLAEAILAKIKGGAPFSEMASVYSEDRQGREGGDWGWVQEYDHDGALVLRRELADAAFSLNPGEVSGVIETPDLICLIMVEAKRPVRSKALSAQDGKPSPHALEQLQSDRERKIEETKHATAPSPTSRATTNFTGAFDLCGTKPESAVQYDYTTGIATVTNGGVVRYNGAMITADSITFDPTAKTITAEGNVSGTNYPSPNMRFSANRIKLSTDNRTVTVEGSNFWTAGGAFTPAFTSKSYASPSGETTNTSPQSASGPRTDVRFTGIGRNAIMSKLDRLRLDSVFFDSVPLWEVVLWLKDEARKGDPEKRGINFMLNPNPTTPSLPQVDPTSGLPVVASEPPEIKSLPITINPALTDVRLADVLEAIVNAADKRIKYSIEDYGVVFSLRGPETEPLSVRQFKVDPITFEQGLQAVTPFPVGSVQASGGQGVGGGGQDDRLSFITRTQALHSVSLAAATFFTSLGVDLVSPKAIALGKAVFWSAGKGMLLVRATKQDLDTIERVLSDFAAKPKSETKAVASPTSVELGKSASRGDGSPSVGTAAPTNGPSGPELHVRSFQVVPKMFYQRLESVGVIPLNQIPESTVMGNTLLLPGVNPQEVERVQNPRTLPPALPQTRDRGGITYITRTNNMQTVSIAAATFFGSLGLDLASSNAMVSGKAIFWNDRRGTLLVRATKQDLDVIERAIETLAAKPASGVNAMELPSAVMTNRPANGPSSTPDKSLLETLTNKVPVLGDLPFIGKFFRSSSNSSYAESLGASKSPTQSTERSGLAAGPNRVSPQINIKVKFIQMPEQVAETLWLEWLFTNRIVSTKPDVTMSSVQMLRIVEDLKSQEGVEILSSPEVMTLSGRRAQVQVVDLRTIVTGQVNSEALSPPGVSSTNVFRLQQESFGTIFDVIPVESADRHAIHLAMTATVTEFLGYDEPNWTNSVTVYVDGKKTTVNPALPHFRKREITANALVRDGQTLVIGGSTTEDVVRVKDKVPVLGDLPLAGRLFRRESTTKQKKTLIIFVTPTLVDSSGNRIHGDDEPATAPK